MNSIRNKLISVVTALLLTFAIFCAVIGFTGCTDNGDSAESDLDIRAVYDLYAESAGDDAMTYEQWLESIKGAKGDRGEKGEKGDNGENGSNGKSAYELYVDDCKSKNQTPLNSEEWLESLNGSNGKSAYELYVEDCKSKNQTPLNSEEWLESLNGSNGKSAYELYVDDCNANSQTPKDYSEWQDSLKGENGDSLWTVNSGAPTAEDGKNGDLWLDIDSKVLYYKQSGEWTALGKLGAVESEEQSIYLGEFELTGAQRYIYLGDDDFESPLDPGLYLFDVDIIEGEVAPATLFIKGVNGAVKPDGTLCPFNTELGFDMDMCHTSEYWFDMYLSKDISKAAEDDYQAVCPILGSASFSYNFSGDYSDHTNIKKLGLSTQMAGPAFDDIRFSLSARKYEAPEITADGTEYLVATGAMAQLNTLTHFHNEDGSDIKGFNGNEYFENDFTYCESIVDKDLYAIKLPQLDGEYNITLSNLYLISRNNATASNVYTDFLTNGINVALYNAAEDFCWQTPLAGVSGKYIYDTMTQSYTDDELTFVDKDTKTITFSNVSLTDVSSFYVSGNMCTAVDSVAMVNFFTIKVDPMI